MTRITSSFHYIDIFCTEEYPRKHTSSALSWVNTSWALHVYLQRVRNTSFLGVKLSEHMRPHHHRKLIHERFKNFVKTKVNMESSFGVTPWHCPRNNDFENILSTIGPAGSHFAPGGTRTTYFWHWWRFMNNCSVWTLINEFKWSITVPSLVSEHQLSEKESKPSRTREWFRRTENASKQAQQRTTNLDRTTLVSLSNKINTNHRYRQDCSAEFIILAKQEQPYTILNNRKDEVGL